MNFATTKERILQFLENKGITVTKFFAETGIRRGFLDTDKLSAAVSDVFIAKIIATYPELNVLWLITGEGEMVNSIIPVNGNASVQEPSAAYQSKDDLLISTQLELIVALKEISTLKDKVLMLEQELGKVHGAKV